MCVELERLRIEATRLHRELQEKRRMAQERSKRQRDTRRSNNDFEFFLMRRLAKASAAIEQHLAKHGCSPEF